MSKEERAGRGEYGNRNARWLRGLPTLCVVQLVGGLLVFCGLNLAVRHHGNAGEEGQLAVPFGWGAVALAKAALP